MKHAEFGVHQLNGIGMNKANAIRDAFDECLTQLELYCMSGREFSIVKTKLEEACFFAKKSMAILSENQVNN